MFHQLLLCSSERHVSTAGQTHRPKQSTRRHLFENIVKYLHLSSRCCSSQPLSYGVAADYSLPTPFFCSIFASPDQQLNTSLKPAAHNTGGSLPDLTNIQFPPPLPTPLDSDDAAAASFGPSQTCAQGSAAVSSPAHLLAPSSPSRSCAGNIDTSADSDLRCQLRLILGCLYEAVFVFWVGVSASQPAVTMEMQPGPDSMVPLILNAGESHSLQLSPTSPPLSLSQVQYD